ncbi:hypothetical protein ACHAPJ_001569 [Fusarium lateritium]
MAQTFHRFADFPWDIRELIWKFAISPNSQYHRTADEMNDAFILARARRPSLFMSAPAKMTRAVENDGVMGTEQVPASWFVNNTSTYLSDSGLWTACKESRHVVQRHFRLQEWNKIQDKNCDSHSTSRDLEEMPHLVHFRDKDSKGYYSTILPHQDLFAFQAVNWDLGWQDMEFDVRGSNRWHDQGIKNIAIEFDQEWGARMYRLGMDSIRFWPSLSYMAANAKTEGNIDTFWLIHYCIKRRAHVPTKKQANFLPPRVFYQDGRRFTEVSPLYVLDSPWEQCYQVSEDEWMECYHFFNSIQIRVEDMCDASANYHIFECLYPEFGVLACEEY